MSLPFDPRGGLIVVPTRLSGPAGTSTIHLALDTGANRSLVNSAMMVRLGYDPAAAPDRLQMVTASGVEFAPRIVVERIEALGWERRSVPVVCHTLPASTGVDGVLGLDFFRGRRLIVDFRAGLVTVE